MSDTRLIAAFYKVNKRSAINTIKAAHKAGERIVTFTRA
jgi:hypothetical protein